MTDDDQDPYGAAITTGVLLFGLVGFGLVLLSIAGCTTPDAAPARVYTLPDGTTVEAYLYDGAPFQVGDVGRCGGD